ncbi:MAG: hypothetical protein Q8Q01_04660 [archaeon]|nr:hypothetical protein [archaeon]
MSYRYYGFFERQENRPDNRVHYRELLEDERVTDKKNIRKLLDFEERFPPDQPLERLVGHEVKIFGGLMKPFFIDIGKELLRHLDKEYYREEIVKSGVIIPMPDGTYIKGDRIRRVPIDLNSQLEEAREYLGIEFEPKKMNSYKFDVQKISGMEFHTISYVEFNGQRIEENLEVTRIKRKDNKDYIQRRKS